jgi:hypothetical protein
VTASKRKEMPCCRPVDAPTGEPKPCWKGLGSGVQKLAVSAARQHVTATRINPFAHPRCTELAGQRTTSYKTYGDFTEWRWRVSNARAVVHSDTTADSDLPRRISRRNSGQPFCALGPDLPEEFPGRRLELTVPLA